MAVIVTLSAMMSFRISAGEAPMAFRMPNSRVRSFTVMSMMLETPTMPLMSVSMPKIQRAVLSMPAASFICRFSV